MVYHYSITSDTIIGKHIPIHCKLRRITLEITRIGSSGSRHRIVCNTSSGISTCVGNRTANFVILDRVGIDDVGIGNDKSSSLVITDGRSFNVGAECRGLTVD